MAEASSSQRAGKPPRSWRLRLLFAAAGAFLVLVLGILAVSRVNRARLKRQLREIAERGEPVVLPDAISTAVGAKTLEWLRPFEDSDGEEGEWVLQTATGIARFLALPEGRELGEEQRAQLQRLAECLRAGSRWGEGGDDSIAAHAYATLRDGVPPERWDECLREYILTRELAHPRLRAALSSAIPTEPLDAEGGRGLERIPKHLPWINDAHKALLEPISALAARSAASEIVERLAAARRVDALFGRQVSLIALMFRCFLVRGELFAIEIALAQLPPEAALDPLASLFDTIEEPRAEFRRAVCEDRAMGNEAYTAFSISDPQVHSAHDALLATLLSFDQPYYLSAFGEALACLDEESLAGTEAGILRLEERLRARAGSWLGCVTPVALHLLPRFSESWRCLCDQRARIELVRLGLRLRALSPEAALAGIASSHDPYSSGPVRARMDEGERLLTLWSVGPNGRDDGAPTQIEHLQAQAEGRDLPLERDDLVVRVRMR